MSPPGCLCPRLYYESPWLSVPPAVCAPSCIMSPHAVCAPGCIMSPPGCQDGRHMLTMSTACVQQLLTLALCCDSVFGDLYCAIVNTLSPHTHTHTLSLPPPPPPTGVMLNLAYPTSLPSLQQQQFCLKCWLSLPSFMLRRCVCVPITYKILPFHKTSLYTRIHHCIQYTECLGVI